MSDMGGAGGLRASVQRTLGAAVTLITPVHGGDTAAAYRVDLADGRRVFAKTHAAPPPGFFTTEAAGLEWLRAAHAVNVASVVAVSDGADGGPAFLVLEWIDIGGSRRAAAGTERAFGHGLAELHRFGAAAFGRWDGRTTGSLAVPNDPCPTWPEFYAQRRLLPLARLALDRGVLAPDAVAGLERIAATLDRFDDRRQPARLHGDLWAGNRVVDGRGESWLIDPAAHGGHPEFDLAMMRLFGGFGTDAFGAYQEANPLSDGWEGRVQLHQLAPLVVHAIKFGGHYVAAARSAIERYR